MSYRKRKLQLADRPYGYTAPPKRRRIPALYAVPAGPMYRTSAPLPRYSIRGPAPEKKVSDIAVGTVQVNTTGTFSLLHFPNPGTDYTNRIGRKTLAKSIYVRGFVCTEASLALAPAAVPAQEARMILFVDNQPNGAAPAVTDLLNTASPSSQLNLNNRDRFKILKDKLFTFDPFLLSSTATQSYASTNRQCWPLKVYKRCSIETIFNAGTAATIADQNSGAIYMFWIGSNAAGTNTDANAVVSTRVRFIDN